MKIISPQILGTDTDDPKMPSRGKHLAHVIKDFVRAFPRLATQTGAVNKCKMVSYEAVLYLRQRGFNARLIHLQNCPKPTYPSPHRQWAERRRDTWSHYVVGIGHWAIDFTAKQFDAAAAIPTVTPLAQVRAVWATVEDDKFMNNWVKESTKYRKHIQRSKGA